MSIESYFSRLQRSRPTEGVFARFSDLFLVGAIAGIVAMMILPLPALAIDSLVALNITFGIVLMMVAVYIASPLEFSVFPSVLLISTLFRLSLSIATTRMILLEGHAGHIIDTFGMMVAGGNLVVGLVVFLIITIVQFIVIAKGAERVAEVAARFSLDAMPGKQLSIDSDLRSGLIDKDEARRRRKNLELESKLHGSLDGAMKFVKGDAMAGIIIVVVNLLGGLAIGVMQQGMSLGDAIHKYSILTIGDGLVTQIPALLGAIAAGLIVTRTTDEATEKHLGDAIRRQLATKPRVFMMAGLLCFGMALVPGFPALVFVVLGATALVTGVLLNAALRERIEAKLKPLAPARPGAAPAELMPAQTKIIEARPTLPLLLELRGVGAADGQALAGALEATLDRFELELGVVLPRLSFHATDPTEAPSWRLLAWEAPLGGGDLPTDDPVSAAAAEVRETLRRNLGLFVGIQEASVMLNRASVDYPEVVKEVARALPLARIAEVIRRLVEEEVSVRNLRDVLEGLADAGQREKDAFALCEFARVSLKRQIAARYAPDGELRALVLSSDLEAKLREAVRTNGGSPQLALDPLDAQALIQALTREIAETGVGVVVTAIDLRRHVRKLIEPDLFDVAVLSFHELPPTLRFHVAGRVAPPQPLMIEAA